MRRFLLLLVRDLRLALRQRADHLVVVAFFGLAVLLFPLSIGSEPALLERVGPGLLWVCALLSAMLSLDRLFQDDHQDGGLDLLVLSPLPLEAVVLAKSAAHWLTTGVPLLLVCPVLALPLGLDGRTLGALEGSLLLGTPALSLIGALGAALVLGARRSGVLVSFVVLPLASPVLILGAGAAEAARQGATVPPHLLLLGALLLAVAALVPWAAAAALRQALE